jgi:hypothetical protein
MEGDERIVLFETDLVRSEADDEGKLVVLPAGVEVSERGPCLLVLEVRNKKNKICV